MTLQLRRRLAAGPRLQGRLSDGTPATLFDAVLVRLDSKGEHYVQELGIGAVVLGLDLPDQDHPALTFAGARIDGLEQVIGTSGLSLETSDISSQSKPFARIEWQSAAKIEARLPGGILTLSDYVRFEHDSYFRFALEHRAIAHFQAAGPFGLQGVEGIFDALAGFLAFATEAQIELGPLELAAVDSDPDAETAELLVHRRPRYGRALEATEPWLTLAALSEPAIALAGFYRFQTEQPSAYLILFEYLVFAAQLNPIDKLLYLARFLEVYHRTADPRQRDPEDVHNARKTLVKEALADEHKEWGAQLLHHSNEVSFKERVAELLAGAAAAATPILGAEAASFSRLLGNCRNYWTHYSPDMESKALRDLALDNFDDRLLLVVRACVLNHIGVPAEEARRCLEADWRWKQRSEAALEQPG
jgi:hypothetical protein